MRALSNLITVNDPDLVLFVGEALVRCRLTPNVMELMYRGSVSRASSDCRKKESFTFAR